MKFSIIICTYNRDQILKESIGSIVNLDFNFELFEIIIVDNYGKSNTKEIVTSFLICTRLNIKYIYEETPGLSYARNTGYEKASGEWIFYLDDDALVDRYYLQLASKYLSDSNIECIGGIYNPWYKFKKPKWYIDEWSTSMNKPSIFSVLTSHQYLDGNNFIISKQLIVELGGFRTDLGMKSMSIGYGEETELQIRARQYGKDIYYSPELIVSHLVPQYKMRLKWILKSWYHHGKSYWVTYKVEPHAYRFGIKIMVNIIFLSFKNITFNISKLLRKDYYFQNLIIDSLKLPIWELGRFFGSKNN